MMRYFQLSMAFAESTPSTPVDSPEARRYNRIHRWLGIADFVIQRDPAVAQAIQLVGIESPGLTAAPAIAQHVSKLVEETLA